MFIDNTMHMSIEKHAGIKLTTALLSQGVKEVTSATIRN